MWSNVVLLYILEDSRIWVHWNHCFNMHLPGASILHLISTFNILHINILSFFRAYQGEWLQFDAARWQGFFPSWVPSGLISSPAEMAAIPNDCVILCLLIGQEIFHFSTSQTRWSRQISEDVARVPAFEQVPKVILMNSQKNWPLGGTCCFKYSLSSSCVSFIPPVRLFAPGGILHVLMFWAGGYIVGA